MSGAGRVRSGHGKAQLKGVTYKQGHKYRRITATLCDVILQLQEISRSDHDKVTIQQQDHVILRLENSYSHKE